MRTFVPKAGPAPGRTVVTTTSPPAAAPPTSFRFAQVSTLAPRETIQCKLTVGAAGDAHEREADRAADAVMGESQRAPALSPIAPRVQRACDPCEEKDEEIRRAPLVPEPTPTVDASVGGELQGLRAAGGAALPSSTLDFMQHRFGHDFSQVRIHHGPRASRSASALSARAFTVGRDVVFNQGEYAPDTVAGQRLIAHELAHVVQQREGAGALVQRQGCPDRTSSARPILFNGITDPAVAEVKRKLNAYFKDAPANAAGVIGVTRTRAPASLLKSDFPLSANHRIDNTTTVAIQIFQNQNGLNAMGGFYGVVERCTWEKLDAVALAAVAAQPQPATAAQPPTASASTVPWDASYANVDLDAMKQRLHRPTPLLGGLSVGYHRWLEIRSEGLVEAAGPPPGRAEGMDYLRKVYLDPTRNLLVLRQGWTIRVASGELKDLFVEVWWFAADELELKVLSGWANMPGVNHAYSMLMRPVAGDSVLVELAKREFVQSAIAAAGIATASLIAGGLGRYTRPSGANPPQQTGGGTSGGAASPEGTTSTAPPPLRLIPGGGGRPSVSSGGARASGRAFEDNRALKLEPQPELPAAPPRLQSVPKGEPAPAQVTPTPSTPAPSGAAGLPIDPTWILGARRPVLPSAERAPRPAPSPEPRKAPDEEQRRQRCPQRTRPIYWPYPVWRRTGHGDRGSTSGDYDRPLTQVVAKRDSPERNRTIIGEYVSENWAALRRYYASPQGTLGAIHHKVPLYLGGPDTKVNFVFLLFSEHNAWHSTLTSQTTGAVGTRYCVVN